MAITNHWIAGTAFDDLNDTYVGYNGIAIDSLGNIVCGGSSDVLTLGSYNKETPIIIKYNRDGSVIWSYYIPYSFDGTVDTNYSYAVVSSLKVDSSDNIYASCILYNINNTSDDYSLLLKLNKYGTLIWSKKIKRNDPDITYYAKDLAIDSSRNLYLHDEANYTVSSFDGNGNFRWSKVIESVNTRSFCIIGNQLIAAVIESNNSFSLNFINKDTGAPLSNKITINDASNTLLPEKLVYDGTRYLYVVDSNQIGIIKIDTVDYTVVWRKRFRRSDNGQSADTGYVNLDFKDGKLYYVMTLYDLSDTSPYTGLNRRVLHIGEISSAGNIAWTNKLYLDNTNFNNDIWTYWYYYTQNFDVANNYLHIAYSTAFNKPIGEFGGITKFSANGSLLQTSPIGPTQVPFYYVDITTAVTLQSLVTNITYDNSVSPTSTDFLINVTDTTLTLSDIYNSSITTRTWYDDGTDVGYIAVNGNAQAIIDAMTGNTSNNGSNTSNNGSNTSNTGSNTSNTISNTANIVIDPFYIPYINETLTANLDKKFIFSNGPNVAQANTIGYVVYNDKANLILDAYSLVNTANIEYVFRKFDVGQNLYFDYNDSIIKYKNFSELLYLYPPPSFTANGVPDPDANTANLIDLISSQCCLPCAPAVSSNGVVLVKDQFGNLYEPETVDTRCYGFSANDVIWQDRDDGKRVWGIVAREDCANLALYVNNATSYFVKDRMIYKDNGTIEANVFAVFANVSGKIDSEFANYIVSVPDWGPGPWTTPLYPVYINTSPNVSTSDKNFLVANRYLQQNSYPVGNVRDAFNNAQIGYTAIGMKVTDNSGHPNNLLVDITSSVNSNGRFTVSSNGVITFNFERFDNSTLNTALRISNKNTQLMNVYVNARSNVFTSRINVESQTESMHTKTYAEDVSFVRATGGNLTINLANSQTFIIGTDGNPVSRLNLIKPSYDPNANRAYSATLVFSTSVTVTSSAWSSANVHFTNGVKPFVANAPVVSIMTTSVNDNIWYGFGTTTYTQSNTGFGGGLGPNNSGYNFLWYSPSKSHTLTITNSWTSNNGIDLDTRTWIETPNVTKSWSNAVVGWDYNNTVFIGNTVNPYGQNSMTFSGDDTTSTGYEIIKIPIDTIIGSDPYYYGNSAPIVGYSNTVSYTNMSFSDIPNTILGRAGMSTTIFNSYMDDSSVIVNVPFNFSYAGKTRNLIYVGSNGYLTFNAGYGTIGYPTSTDIIRLFTGDRALWYVGTLTSGTTPNRTFRMRCEWNTFYPSGNPPVNFLEFVFYENDPNRIDIHAERLGIGTFTTSFFDETNYLIVENSLSANTSRSFYADATITTTPIYAAGVYDNNTNIKIHVGAFWYETRNDGNFNFEIKNDVTGAKMTFTPNVQHRSVVGTGLNEWAVFQLNLKYLTLTRII